MKTFKTKSMALLLAVLMLLSSVVTGTFAFTASAEEAPEAQEAEYEAALFMTDGVTPFKGSSNTPLEKNTGTFLEMVEATKPYADNYLVLKLYKDIELTESIVINAKRLATIDGQGHTIYMSKELLESGDTYFISFSVPSKATFPCTFKNLNFNGQPMNWDGTKENAIVFGDNSKAHGAILLSVYAKLTMDNCRMENFYTKNKASCIYMQGPYEVAAANEDRGLVLKDTVITNNHSLGSNTPGGNASAIRPHYNKGGAKIYVSGSTYVDNNYLANGTPAANIHVAVGDSTVTGAHNTSATLYVASDFTGAVATCTYGVEPKENTKYDEAAGSTEEDKTIRGAVIFEGPYDPTDGGFVYGASGSTRMLFLPVDPTQASDVKVLTSSHNVYYYLDSTKEWATAAARTMFEALSATKDASGTYTDETRLAAAKKNVVVFTGDVLMTYNNKQLSGMYTVYGNGHELRSPTATGVGGLPMLRFGDSDPNTTVIFNDLVMNGDVRVSVGEDGYLEFDQISTEAVETDVKGIGAGSGGALGSYNKGQYIALNNVEIKNFVQTRCSWENPADDARQGAAFHDEYGANWHLNNVYIHDNYTGYRGSAIYAKNVNTKIYFSGDIKFENNYMTEYKTGDGSVVDNFKIVREADVWVNLYKNIYFEETAVSDSVIMGNCCDADLSFACVAEGADVNFVNSLNSEFTVYTNGTFEGYDIAKWQDPANLPEEVTFKIYGRDNTTVVIDDLTRTISNGNSLPGLTGLTWYNGETAVTTHTKGVTTYEGKWNEDATARVLYSTDNRQTWSTAADFTNLSWSEEIYTDVELLQGFAFEKSYAISYKQKFVLDGNGFTNTVSKKTISNVFTVGTSESEQNTKTFKNFNFDGTDWNAIGDGGLVTLSSLSGTWVFDNCVFSNCVGTKQAGVLRPVGEVTLVLKDVIMDNCTGSQGSIRTGFAGDLGPVIKLEGSTTITGGNNRIYFNTVGAIAVSGDFTGTVDIYGSGLGNSWTTVDKIVASSAYVDLATVAPGAVISGKIWNKNDTSGELFAYDNNGILCWGNEETLAKPYCTFDVKDGVQVINNGRYGVGTELPAPRKADLTGETPVYYTAKWYYDNAGVATETAVTVEGVTAYYVGEYTVDTAVEAYIDADTFGALLDVMAMAQNGDRIELIKDVALSERLEVYKSVTIDGNGHTLSYALDENDCAILRNTLVYIGMDRDVTFTDIVFDGGAAEEGVWTHQIHETGYGFVNTGTASTGTDHSIVYNNCTFRGLRMLSSSETFSMIHVNNRFKTYFTGTTLITDNMIHAVKYENNKTVAGELATDKNCTDGSGKVAPVPSAKVGAVIRPDRSSAVYIQDNAQIVDNFMVYQIETEGEGGGKVYTPAYTHHAEITSGGSNENPGFKRFVIGPLADTAEIRANFNQGYMVAVDSEGNPYPIGDKVKNQDGSNSYNYMVSAHNPNAADVAADLAFHTSVGGDVLPIFRTDSAKQIVRGTGESATQIGGNLNSDRMTLDIYLTIKAAPTETLKVYIGDALVENKTVGEYGTHISRRLTAADTYGQLKISVDVGMAQLTDTITIALCNKDGSVHNTFTTTAKGYIDLLIASDVANAALKNALGALLQYGAMAQVQFEYNTDKLANDGDYSALDFTRVDEKALFFADAAQVKATKTGSLAGVSVVGSSLLLNNQITLRIYVTTEDASAYTFTVDGKAYELQTGKNGSYIEIANIGTAKLAEFVTLTIAPKAGEGSIVYKVSPMSYVYAVNGNASQPKALKDVCEAMFYYFDAVVTAYDLAHGIAFSTEQIMSIARDQANNAYSIPYGIAG